MEDSVYSLSSDIINVIKITEKWIDSNVDDALRIFLVVGLVIKLRDCSNFNEELLNEKCVRDSRIAEYIIDNFLAFSNIPISETDPTPISETDPTQMYIYFGVLAVSICVLSALFFIIILILATR